MQDALSLFHLDKKKLLHTLDTTVSHVALDLLGERKGLSTFLFHGVYRNESEISKHHIFPQELLTVALFRRFLDYFLSLGYQFISPEALLRKDLDTSSHYGLVTFDDGYFNNTLLLDVLKEYQVPAVFFVPTSFVREGEKLWSDIVYHERHKRGVGAFKIGEEIKSLRLHKLAYIKDYITKEWGTGVFNPLGDIDRFLNETELKHFAQNPLVHIGNHTHSHEVLTHLSKEEIRQELETSQNLLHEMIGKEPHFISYPYGAYSNTVVEVVREMKFPLGITTIQTKNRLPLTEQSSLLLRRFNPVAKHGEMPLEKFRSPIQLKTFLKNWLQ